MVILYNIVFMTNIFLEESLSLEHLFLQSFEHQSECVHIPTNQYYTSLAILFSLKVLNSV